MSVRVMAYVWEIPSIQGTELLVMLALADFCNDEWWCWPSVATVAKKSRLSERGARGILRRLEEKGLIECPEKTGGRGFSNRYRIRRIDTEKAAQETRNDVPPLEEKAETECIKAAPAASAEPSKNHQKDSISIEFEEWWQLYPRKVAKGSARRAFKVALRKADLKTLCVSATEYAKAVHGKDAQFIAHPATWLNGERWLDTDAKPETRQPASIDSRLRTARDWLSKHDAIPDWMDDREIADALIKEGHDYEKLRLAGFSLPPIGNVVNIGELRR